MLLILPARDILKMLGEQTCLNIKRDTKCHECLKLQVLQPKEEDVKGCVLSDPG